jgi:hypothetical protein
MAHGGSRVAVLSLTDPGATQTGGTLRIRALAAALQALHFDVDLLYPQDASGAGSSTSTSTNVSLGERPMPGRLRSAKRHYLPMPTMTGGRNSALVRQLSRQDHYEGVVVSALSQVPLALAAEVPIWLDFMDLWSDFCRREKTQRSGLARLTTELQSRHLRRLEARFARRAAVVTAAGWKDCTLLSDMEIPSIWLPVALPDDSFSPRRRDAKATPAVGLLGNFRYWPNADAYEALVKYWLPSIRTAGWRCVVAGIGSERLPPASGVKIVGPLNDVNDFYRQIDLIVAPMRLGGGIKVKIIESLSRGVPVIATPLALEGFPPYVKSLVRQVELHEPEKLKLHDLSFVSPADNRLHQFTLSGSLGIVQSVVRVWLGDPFRVDREWTSTSPPPEPQ